jgi:hypothetical protein
LFYKRLKLLEQYAKNKGMLSCSQAIEGILKIVNLRKKYRD